MWQIQVLLFGTFWNFLFLNIFDLWLIETAGTEHLFTNGRLYIKYLANCM